MTKIQSLYIAPKLKDFGGNMSKQWYIEYSAYSPADRKKNRMRYSEGINQIDDVEKRRKYCYKKMAEILDKLKNNELPCQQQTAEYEDELLYENQTRNFGNKRVNKVTIRTYLSEFIKLKKTEVVPHTYTTYKSKLRIFADWSDMKGYSSLRLSDWNNQMIIEFFKYICERNNLSRLTMRKYKQIITSFFWFLINSKGLITANPVHNIPNLGDVVDAAPVPMTKSILQQFEKYLTVNNPQLWLVCLMQYYCALRPGQELRLMKVGDINFQGHYITVRSDLAKNKKRETVDMPNQLYRLLVDVYHIDSYDPALYLFGRHGIPGDEPTGKNTFRFRFDSARKLLGISDVFKLYSFKHTGAVAMINAGFNPQELQRHLRHSSLLITEHYIRRNVGERNIHIRTKFPSII